MTADAWARLQADIQRDVGVTLFTVLAFTHGGTRMERIHSSHPVEYPVGGAKDVATEVSPDWIAVSRDSVGTFFGPTVADIERVFGDAELIRSLGCGAIINVPLRDAAGVHWGTANLLAPEDVYDESSVARAEAIVEEAGRRVPNPTETADDATSAADIEEQR